MSAYPIPNDALDDRLGWTGSSGTGKTYDSGTAVERVLRGGSRVCIIDPLGVWWGLRLRRDGESPSPFKVAIFGGPHADIAITETSGKLIGEAVAGTKESCIVDLSEFDTEPSQRRFMLAFLVALFGGLKGNLLHLVLDEADMWVPQTIQDKEGDATRLHHNVQKIVRRGRVKGFIPWLITQRPAEISKSVLSMMDGMVIHQAPSPQDIKAVMEWVKPRADSTTAQMIHDGLPAFERGQAVVYIPRRRILSVARFPEKSTFDSSRAPNRDEKKNRPNIALKPLDIDAIKKRLEKVEAEAKANDPAKLRNEIAALRAEKVKLERQAATAATAKPAPDKDALAAAEQRGFEQARKEIGKLAARAMSDTVKACFGEMERQLRAAMGEAKQRVSDVVNALAPTFQNIPFQPIAAQPLQATPPMQQRPHSAQRAEPKPATGDGGSGNSALAQKLLDALAELQVLGVNDPARELVALMARYSLHTNSVKSAIVALKNEGLIEYGNGTLRLTADGATRANAAAAPRDATEMRARITAILGEPTDKLLTYLSDIYPQSCTREELASACGYSIHTNRVKAAIVRLKDMGFLTYPSQGYVRADDTLFPEGRLAA